MISQNENGLQVTGAMLNTNATALLDAGRGFLRAAGGARSMNVDLSAVEDTDASALGVLFAWLRTARQLGIELRVAHVPASMVSQARLYGVYESLPLA
jgi:ABC-type transporter Mla MlaB component